MYAESNNTKKYEFNVTWRVNSEPYFSPTTHTQVLRTGQDMNITFATATDDESDSIYYFLANITSPLQNYMHHGDLSGTMIEFTGITTAIVGTYEFFIEPWEYANHTYCGTPLNVTVIINSLPVYGASLSSNYQQIPYISNADIKDTCPWFTDADGDTLTVSISRFKWYYR